MIGSRRDCLTQRSTATLEASGLIRFRIPFLSTLSRARREVPNRSAALTLIWSALAGLLVPVLVVLVGTLAVMLNEGRLDAGWVRLGTHLFLPVPAYFSSLDPLTGQLLYLIGLGFVITCVFSFATWLQRRAADSRAREITKSLHRQLLEQSLRRAEVEGAAAQAVQAEALIGTHLPNLHRALSLWYRSIPRSLLTLIGCVLVALLVNLWLAIAAVVSGVLIGRLFRTLRSDEVDERIQWELPLLRKRMAELVGQAPLMARLHSAGLADQAFESELQLMYKRMREHDHYLARLWPLIFTVVAIAIGLIVCGMFVNADQGLGLPSALTIGLALASSFVVAGRLWSLSIVAGRGKDSSDAIYHYLQRSSEIAPSEQRVGLAGVRESVDLQDVTLGNDLDSPILEHLTLRLTPGSLVAIMGTDPISTRAFSELLMGFGMPGDGRVTIDGIHLRDLHPQALAKNVMWVDPSGPIYDGSIEENVKGKDDSIDSHDVAKALEEVAVYEKLFRLPEGLGTIVSPETSSLDEEATYAIGIARALLHKPPIVLAIEPASPAEHLPDDPCLAALHKLANQGSIVVVLPKRLQTLRTADRVILFNGPRLVGEGKHADLLSDSDLYRHLNYLLFNPYRHR